MNRPDFGRFTVARSRPRVDLTLEKVNSVDRGRTGHPLEFGWAPDPEYPDFGQRDEIYYVVHGQVRITWSGGQVLATENTAVHLAKGLNYELLCERDAEILFVLTPPLAPPT
jgi:ethanolamine utilization protein EutQ (cupin superfamily)